MAPWTPRVAPTGNAELPNPAPSNPTHGSPIVGRHPLRIAGSHILAANTQDLPALQQAPETLVSPSSRGRPSGHGRSMSHPFPSLFKKKGQGENVTSNYNLAYDGTSGSPPPPQSPSKATAGKLARVPDKDLKTGKCMTCSSMVRWPKDLIVFRCTVCLTINDLKPVNQGPGGRGSHRVFGFPSGSLRSDSATALDIGPISADTTSALIEHCISTYISSRLGRKADNFTDLSTSQQHFIPLAVDRVEVAPDDEIEHPKGIRIPQVTVGLHLTQGTSECRQYSSSTPGNYATQTWQRNQALSLEDGSVEQPPMRTPPPPPPPPQRRETNIKESGSNQSQDEEDHAKYIFKLLEDYIIACFTSHDCINTSFSTLRPSIPPRALSEDARRTTATTASSENIRFHHGGILSALDAKTLLVGDFAENGSWWSGSREQPRSGRSRSYRNENSVENHDSTGDLVSLKSPRIDWAAVATWYDTVLDAGNEWKRQYNDLVKDKNTSEHGGGFTHQELHEVGEQILDAQAHTRRVLLKASESLLKRPGGTLRTPNDIRFLLIILANPLLYPTSESFTRRAQSRSKSRNRRPSNNPGPLEVPRHQRPRTLLTSPRSKDSSGGPGQHSGMIKRVLGLLSNLPNECHHHLVAWFARISDEHFRRTVELTGSFVTYRLTRQNGKKNGPTHDPSGGLVPSLASSGQGSSAALHAALGVSGQSSKHSDGRAKAVVYNDDWQIKAAARVMALLFSANNSDTVRRTDFNTTNALQRVGMAARERAYHHGQIVATSDFYNTLLDYSDLIADFEAWESKRGKFAFCQYPFFLSIWAKIQIMEFDARRQMEVKAREAFFDSIMSRKPVNQYLVLRIRRECLVEDSLKGVSEVVGAGGEEIKKGLRIEFKGEEGIDAGGLRKEWFLLLVRDVFNPEHGMFIYDEDSQACYFNPNSFETSDQFFLVGVVLGLAIYNSTILDIALPPFAFRKLLAAGPTAAAGAPSHAKPTMVYTLDDLMEFRPSLATGLRQLLEYDGDVESTFCRDFVADVERYGQIVQIPLCHDGEKRAVTNANRREFVDLYVRYLLDVAVVRQFEPFKRGFFTVCGGNALSLFRPEEIELLIRGSEEPLDITSLKAVSVCENWGVPHPAETEPVISWFWQSFQDAEPNDQRKLLSFITGSDRIPAMGAANLVIKLSCLGEDGPRFPVARTCFNVLSLYRYGSRAKLQTMLWRAVHESEGFGLK